jgi:hypothetical protein
MWIINENYSDDFFLKLITLLAFEVDQFLLDNMIEDIGYYFMEYAWYVISLLFAGPCLPGINSNVHTGTH